MTSLRNRIQREKDFNNILAGTLLFQNDSVIVLGKTVVLQIVTIFRVSYFLFKELISVGMKYAFV